MPAQNTYKRTLFGVQNWLPLISIGLNVLYYAVQSRVTTPMEAAGEASYRIAFVSNEILLAFLAMQLVCIVAAFVFAVRPPTQRVGLFLTVIAMIVFLTQAWILPLVLLWMPCSNWGTRSCPV